MWSLVVATTFLQQRNTSMTEKVCYILWNSNIYTAFANWFEYLQQWWWNRIRKSGEDLKVAAFVSFGQLTTDWCKILFRAYILCNNLTCWRYCFITVSYEFCRRQYLFPTWRYYVLCHLEVSWLILILESRQGEKRRSTIDDAMLCSRQYKLSLEGGREEKHDALIREVKCKEI